MSGPADHACVYGLVLLRNGEVEGVMGSAFAISEDLALSAWHNFTEHGYQISDEIMLCKEIKGGVVLKSCPIVVVADYDEGEDWVILKLQSAANTFPSYATLCPETELPSVRDCASGSASIEAMDFPADWWRFCRRLTVMTTSCRIWNYRTLCVPFPSSRKLHIADEFPQENACMVGVRSRNGESIGSHGGPYVAANGKVFAFHVRTAGYNGDVVFEGRVLASLGSFTAKYSHLFTQ